MPAANYKTKSCHLNRGKPGIKVGFIFSAPGRYEEEAGRPAAKTTGKHLYAVIAGLREDKHLTPLFSSDQIYDYTITNAVTTVHYPELTGRSEGKVSDIKRCDNMRRILREVKGLDYLICFGKKPSLVKGRLEPIGFKGVIIPAICHISMQGLNAVMNKRTSGIGQIPNKKWDKTARLNFVIERLIAELTPYLG